MPDDTRLPKDAGLSATLAQIADALGLPTSHFYMAAGGEMQDSERTKLEGTAILTLVQSHLQTISPENRRSFVEAVKAIADVLPS